MSKAVSKAAATLGRRAKGVPKNYSPEERERRAERMREVNKRRLEVRGQVKPQEPPETKSVVPPAGDGSGRTRAIVSGSPRRIVVPATPRFKTATIRA